MEQRQTQAARSEATRDGIVQAALGVFALKGFAAATMDDVCLAAGCSKGGLYHHFRTKSSVLSSVVDRLAAANALLPGPAPVDGLSLAPEALGRVLIEVWAEAARDGGLRDKLRAGYERRMELSIDNGAVAEILRIGALIQLLTRSERPDAEEAARRLGIERAA